MAGGSHGEKPIAVYGAIVANFIIAVTKFGAAFFTGSSAMISEGIHSVVDTGNQTLLLFGLKRSKQPADDQHPFGHGKELYFWGLIVAMILFGLGGGMSIYEGIRHIRHPGEVSDPTWNYIVLAISLVVEGISWGIALKVFLGTVETEQSYWQAIRSSKDPTVYVVLFEDSAALIGLIFAFLGIFFAHRFQMPMLDGVASILIGLALGAVAVFLAYETKGLLIGESADDETVRKIREIAQQDQNVEQVKNPQTVHFGPHEILVNMDIEFRQDLSNGDLLSTVNRIEKNIRKQFPIVKHIFIEAESLTKGKGKRSQEQSVS